MPPGETLAELMLSEDHILGSKESVWLRSRTRDFDDRKPGE
jgi:hypothetical protein